MPVVNIYCNKEAGDKIWENKDLIQKQIAQQLSCPERSLKPDEIDLRPPITNELNTNVRIDIGAQEYTMRKDNEDQICKNISEFISGCIVDCEVLVWLWLCEMGHSF